MPTAIFEIGTEELPADAVEPLAVLLGWNIYKALHHAEVHVKLDDFYKSKNSADSITSEAGSTAQTVQMQTFLTPRRLAVLLSNLPATSPAKTVVTHGPPTQHCLDADNQPTAALLGFARKMGVQPDDLEQVEVDGVLKIAYQQQQPGLPHGAIAARSSLPTLLPIWCKGTTRLLNCENLKKPTQLLRRCTGGAK